MRGNPLFLQTVVPSTSLATRRCAMQFRTIGPAMLAAALLMPAASFGQSPPQSKSQAAPSEEVHDPDACAHARVTPGTGDKADLEKQKGSTLSDKLAQSKGVICPPEHVDPDI